MIDARDVEAFALTAAADGRSGMFNVAAPQGPTTYGDLWQACVDVVPAGDSQLVWVSDEWLSRQDVKPWIEIPLWRTQPGTWLVDTSPAAAAAAGLACRPLSETAADTWQWLGREEPVPSERRADHDLGRDKGAKLLAAWRARHGGAGKEVRVTRVALSQP